MVLDLIRANADRLEVIGIGCVMLGVLVILIVREGRK